METDLTIDRLLSQNPSVPDVKPTCESLATQAATSGKVNQDHQTGASAGHAQPNKSRYPLQPWSKGSENCYVAIAKTCIVVNALIAHIDVSAGT